MVRKLVRWIHVSDWHVPNPLSRDIREILDGLIKDIVESTSATGQPGTAFQPDFVAHTGDLAFSGQDKEYQHALGYLRQLVEAAKVSPERLFVVPGNHDVNDADATSAATLESASDERSYEAAGKEWYDSDTRREILLRRFTHFHLVLSQLIPPENLLTPQIPYYACRFSTACNVDVGIAGLNSALISRKDDEKAHRRMVVGRWQVDDAKRSPHGLGSCDLRIALLHHPFSRLTEYDEHQTHTAIAGSFHVVLSGHLHRTMGRVNLEQDPPLVSVASGAGHEAAGSPKGYVFVELDISAPSLRIHFRRWDDGLREFVPDTGAMKGAKLDGIWDRELPKKMFATSHTITATPTLGPPLSLAQNRLGLPIPRSGLEQLDVFAGYVDRESHRDIARKIQYELSYRHVLSNKCLFWHVDSRRLYHELLANPDYTIARNSEKLFSASLNSLVQKMRVLWGDDTVYTFVCLGVGSGIKEKWLLQELFTQNARARVCILLVDINSQMLQWATSGFREFCDRDTFQIAYIHADFDRLPDIEMLLPNADGPVVFLLLGGLFGNQEENMFLRACKRVAKKRSYLLTGC